MSEEKTYPQMRREFYEKYNNDIIPLVKRYESERRIRLKCAIIGTSIFMGIAIFVAIACIPNLSHMSNESAKGFVQAELFLIGLGWFIWYCIKKSFENKIKKLIMPTVCACFGNLSWYCDLYDGTLFKTSCVVPQFSSEEYDDIFLGSYKDVNIEIVESKFEIGSGRNRHTVFDGVIIKLGMNKSFNGHIVIKPDSIMHMSPSANLKHTELEDVLFEKKFDVFTNDEVEARYLITPSFMERLNKMKVAFNADKISCAFYGKHLLIALSTPKDLFSLCSLITPMDDSKQFFTMYEEIVSILKLIDHFKLNQNIGM